MKWIKNPAGDWVAQGSDGNFLVWKERGFWRGRYLSKDGMKYFKMVPKIKISEMKVMCEENSYWESVS